MADIELTYTVAGKSHADFTFGYDPATADSNGNVTVTSASGTYETLDASNNVVGTDQVTGLIAANSFIFAPDDQLNVKGLNPIVDTDGLGVIINNAADADQIGPNNTPEVIFSTDIFGDYRELQKGDATDVTLNAGTEPPPPPPPPPAASNLSVGFNATTAGFVNPLTPVLAGSVSNASGPASVELYEGDPSNGGQDLGAATVNGDGTWTFSGSIGAGDFNTLTALATDASGAKATAASPFELVTGITGVPYHAVEYDYTADGSYSYTEYSRNGMPVVQAKDDGDGTHTTVGLANNQQLSSIYDDVMTGGGAHQRFIFTPGFGKDEVTNFAVTGAGHDQLDLSNSFSSLGQVLRHTTAGGGSAEIHLDHQDTITLDGVTKAQLTTHPKDFVLG